MQNKGLIKFFAILFALVSIYQLSFTFVASKVKSDAKSFAGGNPEKEVKYLDSIGKEKVFNLGFTDFTFNEVSDKQINKGLDLEGGINVILQISVKDILKGLSNNSKNPIFNKSLADATANQKGNQSYLDAFYDAFDENSKGTVKLASPDIFANRSLQGEGGVDFQMTDAQVKKVISRKVDESVESAFGVLRKRIDKFGVTQPNIQKLGESGRILVELPGAKDVDRIKKLLQSTAQLEFWETYKIEEIGNFLMAANESLKKTEIKTTEVKPVVKDSLSALLTDEKDSTATKKGENPLFDKIIGQGGGPVLGLFSPKDTAVVNGYLKRADIRVLLAGDQRYAKFVWGKPMTIKDAKAKSVDAVELYALKGNRDNVPSMSGGVVTDAKDTFDQMGKPAVSMQMNGQGAKSWEELTGRAYTQKSNIAIVLDDVVYSAPGVSTGPISGGRSEISGAFDVTETKDLANVLRAGKLPAAADIVQSEVVGPSLGQEAIDNGTNSALIGLLLVSLWMMIYYGKAGWYANVALAVNLLFLFGILASIGAVLTLPGIAGIVLTMGTAVDANIIIYERAKEELRSGKTLEEAIKTSYSWRGAMSSITDANVTHILTGAVLFIFGSGPIKGFATTLLIGIVTSLFTSIFIARIFIDWNISRKNNLTFVTNFSKNMFNNFHFDFLGVKKWTYLFSSVVVVISIISLATNGLDQGVDFVGGRTFQVRFEKPIETEAVKAELAKVFDGSAEVKVFGSDNQLKITTKYKVQEPGIKADEEVNKLLFATLKQHFSADMTYEKFVNAYDGKKSGILLASKVGPTVAEDIKTNAYWAVLGAMAIVFLYLMISYRKWQYSLGAIAAIAHDVVFVLGIYSLCYKFMPFGMEIDQHFIAAILTVIGYSMNDTVIVFDRVREYLAGKTKGTFAEIVNQSINTTMSRTINTSLTMIVVLLIMFVFGGESIRGFIFAMLVGIIVGTYSSLFIATPVLVDTISKEDKSKVEKAHQES
ncbi:MAG: protein translocase subunit SecDF [Flavobacterium sp.]|uniref:protein translocase subunit SecDF n=1 Tax=unclassified Flavobacterium TaxID=196869 RepID=UPI000C19838D|nr:MULTISPECIES: protein translocase subunit SecDF [unclassified Flavobacterium]MDP3681325.1 protein translocase subunit SecDF [Flavobacterium sp.]PIF62092.1 protein translocase subunit secF /protein translocase subunit secD [Flavobacterium sp. 11]RKS14981.1 protein translocase subunit secF /protein translocase subunit secD [Flavobacterium sp. 120]WKL43245.1 protein translocase subunit SecDF [Flavobacterium sp. ZE23DGlu08]